MLKTCKNCDEEFSTTSKKATYCGTECRNEGRKAYYRDYYEKNSDYINSVKPLSDEEKSAKFPVGLKMVKGTVLIRKREKRALRMEDTNGKCTVFIEYKNAGVIDTLCPPNVVKTFKEITK